MKMQIIYSKKSPHLFHYFSPYYFKIILQIYQQNIIFEYFKLGILGDTLPYNNHNQTTYKNMQATHQYPIKKTIEAI